MALICFVLYGNSPSSKIWTGKLRLSKLFSVHFKLLYGLTILHICHHKRYYSNKKRKMTTLTVVSKNSIQVQYYFKEKNKFFPWFLQVCLFTCNHNHFKIGRHFKKYLFNSDFKFTILQCPYVRLVKTSPWTSTEGLRALRQTILGL